MKISSKGYCREPERNLFQNLDEDGCTRRDFEDAGGGELYGKMNAVHSSSALACNFFDYWRSREKTALARAMGIKEIDSVEFEKKFRTGMKGTPPHLDVVFTLSDQTIFAIESKFIEPFDGSKNKKVVGASYFSDGREGNNGRWSQLGLPRCQKLAECLREKHCYKYLDVAQLLKHILGIANSRGTGDPMCYENWTLLYLWFNPGGPEADRHEDEIERFAKAIRRDDGKVGDHGEFRAMTYQELFERLSKRLGASHDDYREYLAQRYFRKNETAQSNP